jgi:hypothetical protein
MKKTLYAWKWSLELVAHSPVAVLGLAVLSALWVLAGDQWLALPESSAWMLLLSFLWALAQILIAVSVLAGTGASAAETAAFGSPPRSGLTFITFNRNLLARTALLVLPAALLVFVIAKIFGWVDAHAVEVGSFLTFHSEKPVSHIFIEKIFWWIESVSWIVVWGFLLSFLIVLLRSGWQEALRQGRRTFVNSFGRASFFTLLAGVAVFGGLSYLLVNWHPVVRPGFWDYTQAALRLGVGLLLLAAGWFFTVLSLAKLNPRQDADTHP